MPIHPQPPEPVLEWAMRFPSGRLASAVLRSNDVDEVRAWAANWPGTVELHRRIVLEGNWIPATEAVIVDLREFRSGRRAELRGGVSA